MESSDKIVDLVIQALKEVRDDVKSLDNKIDDMQKVHVKNSVILQEHERRSTASEKRIDELETHYNRLQGFYFYGSIVLAGLAGCAAFFRDVIEGWFTFHK